MRIAKATREHKKKPEVNWIMEAPNPKQKEAFLARTLYVGYGGA